MLSHQSYFVAAQVEQELRTVKQVVITTRKGRTKKKDVLEKAFLTMQVAVSTQTGNKGEDGTFRFADIASEGTVAFADLAIGAAFLASNGIFQRIGRRRALVLVAQTEKKGKPIMPGAVVRARRKEQVMPLSLVWSVSPVSSIEMEHEVPDEAAIAAE